MMNIYIVLGFLVHYGLWSGVASTVRVQHIFANRDSTVSIPCRLPRFDTDQYEMMWSRDKMLGVFTVDDQTLDSQYSVIHDGPFWDLKIKNLQPDNAGKYICYPNTTPAVVQITKLQVQEIELETKRVLEVTEREYVTIECPVSVTDEYTVRWFKGNKPAKNFGGGSSLVMFNVSKNDSGDYRCDAKSRHYQFSRRLTLNVKGIPPTNITANQGSTVILPCKFTDVDIRMLKANWFRGNGRNRTLISIGKMMYIKTDRYSVKKEDTQTWNLQIDNLQPDDGGKFTCQVNTLEKIVNLRVEEIKVITAFKDSTAILPCSYDVPEDSDDARVIWVNNKGLPLSVNQRTFKTGYDILQPTKHDWNLKLNNVQPSDAANFTCTLITKDGGANKTVVLNVADPSIFENMLPEETKVVEGESLTLTCNISGSPQPSYTWYKYSDLIEKHVVTQGPRLTLPHVTRYDASSFECVAEHSFPPTVKMKTDLKVEFAPEIEIVEGKLEIERGSEAILKCDVTSYPQSAVMWIKEGKKLFNNRKYRIEVTEKTGYTKQVTLTIKNTEEDDFGSYICEARNKVDKTQKALEIVESELKTTTKPEINTKTGVGNIRVFTVKKGSTVVLPCEVKTEQSNNRPVLWFETDAGRLLSSNGQSLTNDPRFQVLRPSPTQWNLIIRNVQEVDEKKYSCVTEPNSSQTFYLKVV